MSGVCLFMFGLAVGVLANMRVIKNAMHENEGLRKHNAQLREWVDKTLPQLEQACRELGRPKPDGPPSAVDLVH